MKMPWIDENGCIGCGICVDECPVDTIYMEDDKAIVDMDAYTVDFVMVHVQKMQ